MGILFTGGMGFLLTATMGFLFTMTLGIQLTVSISSAVGTTDPIPGSPGGRRLAGGRSAGRPVSS